MIVPQITAQHNNSLDASGTSGLVIDNLSVTRLSPAASTLTLCLLTAASMFDYVAKFFWALGLIFAGWEHYSWVTKKNQVLSQQPELADSYDRVMWGHTIFYSLPWLVMGIGIVSGHVGNVFDFLRPRSGDAFVLAFYFVVAVSTLSLTVWVWAFGGASYLSPYMKKSPTYVKIQFALATVFLIFWMGMAYMQPAAT